MFRHMTSLVLAVVVLVGSCSAEPPALVDGVLLVDGKPFYPLGGWDDENTTPEYRARLGMNTNFAIPDPSAAGIERFRAHMRECARRGIQVLPYLSYGGEGLAPWPAENVRCVSVLAREPNLLAW